MVQTTTDPVPSTFRVLRRVSPPRSPWPAHVTVLDDGVSGMLVDAAVLREWRGWDIDGAAHVLAPIDVVRRRDGHDVVLWACTERLDTVIARRRGAGKPLAPGEIVTIAVSVVRGLRELCTPPRTGSRGRWWVTAEGRPMFVLGDGPSAAEDSAAILRTLSGATDDDALVAALETAHAATADLRRFRLAADELDDALVATGAPAPIDLGRAAAAAGRTDRPRSAAVAPSTTARAGAAKHLERLRALLAEGLDRLRVASVRIRRDRRHDDSTRRRGPLLVIFGGAAVGVVLLMLLWPAGDSSGGATPSAVPTSSPRSPSTPSTPRAGDVASSSGPADLAAVASRILTSRRQCGGDARCLADVVEDPTRQRAPGVIDLPEEGRTVTVLDSFGGVAVVRVDDRAARMPGQLVVIVADKDRWLLRDVHDVAEQPS